MPRLRFTLARLMAVVLVAALDFSLYRRLSGSLRQGSVTELFVLGALPVVNLLILATSLLLDRLRDEGRAAGFLLGFVAGLGLGVLSFMALASIEPKNLVWFVDRILTPLEEGTFRLEKALPIPVADGLIVAAIGIGYAIPQLALGLLIGLACHAGRIALTVESRAGEDRWEAPGSDRTLDEPTIRSTSPDR